MDRTKHYVLESVHVFLQRFLSCLALAAVRLQGSDLFQPSPLFPGKRVFEGAWHGAHRLEGGSVMFTVFVAARTEERATIARFILPISEYEF